jgi:hypothetical protein
MADMDEPIPQELSAAGGSLPPAFSFALASKTVNRNRIPKNTTLQPQFIISLSA